MMLVPLFDLKFLNEPRRDCCRNFKSAALDRAGALAAAAIRPGQSAAVPLHHGAHGPAPAMSIEEFARAIIDFVRTHEAWAAPTVFALAFGESLAFVSLLLPAWAALVGIGALIGAGGLNFVPIWIARSPRT